MKLIVGLGNPGKAYAHNRHNIGFRCLNYFAKLHSIPIKKLQCHSRIGIGEVAGTELLLAKPQTFVNRSGEAVSALLWRYKISLPNLYVIYDDLDLPLGKIRLRRGGSAGGHKGVDSIISALKSPDFYRIRVGIGRPKDSEGKPTTEEEIIINYVLGDFTPEEETIIRQTIARVAEAIYCILTESIEVAMNRFN